MSIRKVNENEVKLVLLYEEYSRLMFFVAKKILLDDGLAEDAVQEAFIKLMDYLEKIPDDLCNKTRNFVVIIVRSIAIDMLRSRNRKNEVLTESIEEKQLLVDVDVYEEKQAIREIMQEVQKLPLKYRDVMMLRIEYDMSSQEIAKALSLKESTVRSHIMRARKRLRKAGIGGDR